ncbi:PH domain-containing protein [Actinomyces sp. zg-332]|uniref:PH domain-containing protein n=1 Tax=Actinomyces sp. zg-332 TaxID=2708340 RepID=UPI001422AD7C|nr:PH domain-containing protein [Actinomyces sp. zg-332]QPK94324.1 PH domain-containing protein [Actinomyces sp. zg-332]
MSKNFNLNIDGLDYKKVDPKLKKVRRIILAVFILIGIIANTAFNISIFFIDSFGFSVLIAPIVVYILLVVFFIWMWWLIGRQVDNYKYAKAEKDIVISKGVLFRRVEVIPYGRMQFVDVQQGPLLRYYGLASVTLHTASSESLMPIIGMKEPDAKALRQELIELGESNLAGI